MNIYFWYFSDGSCVCECTAYDIDISTAHSLLLLFLFVGELYMEICEYRISFSLHYQVNDKFCIRLPESLYEERKWKRIDRAHKYNLIQTGRYYCFSVYIFFILVAACGYGVRGKRTNKKLAVRTF